MAADVQTRFSRSGRPETPWEYSALIWNFTRRDLKSRFKGTALGWAWSFIAPIATIAIYSIVFSVIIRIQPPPFGDGDPGNYAVWLITGLVTWQFVNQLLTRGMVTLLGNGALLRKVYFPSFVPVIATGFSVGIQSLIELGLVMGILVAFLNVSWTWLLMPLWAGLLWLFATGAAYVLAVANVHWRDLSQIMAVVLQMLFFLTPVIYPLTMVPEQVGPLPARLLVEINPITQFVVMGRQLLYGLEVPSPAQVGYLVAVTALVLVAARWVFSRWGRDIGEAV